MWHGRGIEGRTEHLESLPDRLFEENMRGRIRVGTVLDTLHVLPFAPERITGALERLSAGQAQETGKRTVRIIPASSRGMVREEGMT